MNGGMSDLTMTSALAALREGCLTSVELVQQALAVADDVDGTLGIFIDRYRESALAAAATVDADRASGREVGPLAGLPLGIKDIITTAEGPTTGQSLVHDRGALSGDAVVVQRLRAAGGIVMGKLTTMEFAIGAPDPDKPFPIPRNPWNPEHWTGGSSSGSGGGVAVGAVLGALGTDTGGSIRIPSTFCGITGLMPTYGRVPKSGCIPLGYSLDHIGPMARSAADCALMLGVLAGYDAGDPTVKDVPVEDYSGALTGNLTGVRIGVDRLARISGENEDPALPTVFADAVEVLRARGAQIVEIELPLFQEITAANTLIMVSEAFAYHQPDFVTRWPDFFRGLRRIVGQAVTYSAADYVQAQRARTTGIKALRAVYDDVDVVVTPGAPAGAISFERLWAFDPTVRPAGFTSYWDAMGNPVLAAPIGFTADGLPLGMQIAARPFEETQALRVGDAYQRATDWHLRRPGW